MSTLNKSAFSLVQWLQSLESSQWGQGTFRQEILDHLIATTYFIVFLSSLWKRPLGDRIRIRNLKLNSEPQLHINSTSICIVQFSNPAVAPNKTILFHCKLNSYSNISLPSALKSVVKFMKKCTVAIFSNSALFLNLADNSYLLWPYVEI